MPPSEPFAVLLTCNSVDALPRMVPFRTSVPVSVSVVALATVGGPASVSVVFPVWVNAPLYARSLMTRTSAAPYEALTSSVLAVTSSPLARVKNAPLSATAPLPAMVPENVSLPVNSSVPLLTSTVAVVVVSSKYAETMLAAVTC